MDDEYMDIEHDAFLNIDDGYPTETSRSQEEVEETILPLKLKEPAQLRLLKTNHVQFLQKGLSGPLSASFISLDASRPWIVYWIVHALDLIGIELDPEEKLRAVETIKACQNLTVGGFGGGPSQNPHVATTYAAVTALCILGTPDAYECIDRIAVYNFLLSLKNPDGSFCMHQGGEVDVRGSYCAIQTAYFLNILTPELVENVPEFIVRCQTYEGGIGGAPGSEAHGGYTFCALACMHILNKMQLLDIEKMTDWVNARQMKFEGGFQGRTNKLVDGCYSFWQGGIVTLLELYWRSRSDTAIQKADFFNRESLQNYILLCCQGDNGGLRDKPSKRPDFYHTCYCLSGLSLTEYQYSWTKDGRQIDAQFIGDGEPSLQPTHPAHNITLHRAQKARSYFVDKDG